MVLYASEDALADRMCIPAGDARRALLPDILDAASRWIERETGHVFYTPSVPETRYYTATWSEQRGLATDEGVPYWASQRRGSGLERVDIDEFVSISALATDQDGDGVYETTWTVNTDYWLGPRNAAAKGRPYTSIHRNAVTGRYVFPLFDNALSVTGLPGYSTATPADIRELALEVAEVFARPLADLTIAGLQTYKIGQELSITMKSESLPPLGQQILEGYRPEALVFA